MYQPSWSARQGGKVTDLLQQALAVARSGRTALFVVPDARMAGIYLNTLAYHFKPDEWNVRLDYTNREVRWEGTRGQIRFVTNDRADYDPQLQRLHGYPHDTPTFIDPEIT